MVAPIHVSMPSFHYATGSGGGGFGSSSGGFKPLKLPHPSAQAALSKQIVQLLQQNAAKAGHQNEFGKIMGNLGSDVVDTVMGIPGGIAALVQHPIGGVKAIISSYRDTYGNGWNHFLKTFEAHPLGPILDAVAVATGGAGLVAKGARAAAIAGKTGEALDAAESSRLARLGMPGKNIVRSPGAIKEGLSPQVALEQGRALPIYTHSNPLIRFRQNLTHKFLTHMSDGFKGISMPKIEEVRYSKAQMSNLLRNKARNLYYGENLYGKHQKAVGKVAKSGPEALSVLNHINWFGTGVSPSQRLAHELELARGTGNVLPKEYTDLLGPKAEKLFQEVKAAREAGKSHPILTARDLTAQLGHAARDIHNATPGAAPITDEIARGNRLKSLLNYHGLEHTDENMTALEQGIAHEGGLHPIYNPMKENVKADVGQTVARHPLAPGGNSIKENQMLLHHAGRLALNQDLMGPQFLRTVAHAHSVDVYHQIKADAVKVPENEASAYARKGYLYVDPGSAPDFITRTSKEFENLMGKANGEEHVADWFKRTFVSEDKQPPGETVLMIPKQVVNRYMPSVAGASKFANNVIKRPLTLWKSLILGWSPRFAVNNTVGNTVLAALLHGSPVNAMKGVARLALAHGGPKALSDMLSLKGVAPMSEKTYLTHLPEHHNMTFASSEIPQGTDFKHKLLRGPAHAVVGGHENIWRRKLASQIARANPFIKRELSKLSTARKRGHYHGAPHTDLDVAIENAMKKDPHIMTDVSNKIDDALGNYRQFSHNEQLIRQAVPFYSWYRHISRTSGKLLSERPGRVAALAAIGGLGAERTKAQLGDVPEYLRAYIPFGSKDKNGKQGMFNSTSLNPLNAGVDVARGAKELLLGQTSAAGKDIGGILNPYAGAGIEQLTGKSLLTGSPIQHGPFGLAGNVLNQLIDQLPQGKIAGDLKAMAMPPGKPSIASQLTPEGRISTKGQNKVATPSLIGDLEGYAGIPLKNVNVAAAQKLQKAAETANGGFHLPTTPTTPKKLKGFTGLSSGPGGFKKMKLPTAPSKSALQSKKNRALLAQLLAQLEAGAK